MNKPIIFIITIIVILTVVLTITLTGCSSNNAKVQQGQAASQIISQESNNGVLDEKPSCPRGVTNDPYPGSCWQYTDANQDSLCDLGQ